MADTPLTQIQTRAKLEKTVYPHRIPLTEYESIENFSITDSTVSVLISTYKVEKLQSGTKLLGRGQKLISFSRESAVSSWSRNPTVCFFEEEEEDGETLLLLDRRQGVEAAVSLDQTRWERMAYRVGSGRMPRDSYQRKQQGYVGSVKDWRSDR